MNKEIVTFKYFNISEKNVYLVLRDVGFKPYTPLKWQGTLILPPISPANPRMEPPADNSAPSPPEEPPADRVGSYLIVVCPNIGLDVSKL